MRSLIIIIFLLLLAGCATTDPIDALTKRLNETGGMWINGEYPVLQLPEDTPISAVLEAATEVWGFDEGRLKQYKIMRTRLVTLNTGKYMDFTAVLINSDLGKKIALIRYEGNTTGWWTRFYDAKQ